MIQVNKHIEYRKLGDVCNIATGKLNANAMVEHGKYNFFTCAKEVYRINTYSFDTEALLISGNGSQVGHIHYYSGKFDAYQRTYVLNNFSENIHYIKFVLHDRLKQRIIEEVNTGGVPYIKLSTLTNFLIPIPSIEVQNEIVEVLDKFTELEAELEAELTARKKQYEYYKNKLLINDKFRKIKLSDIGPVKMCRRIFKNQTTDKGDIPFYKIGTFGVEADAYISRELFLEYKDKYPFPNKSDVLLSASGTIGRRVIYEGEDAYFQDSNIVWIDNDETIVLNKYLYYLYGIIDWKVSSGGTISRLYNKTILNTEVLVPPLDEQERIVSILDKFSSLVNDIKEGLPAEIELRRKQYEYYRNKLLTFE